MATSIRGFSPLHAEGKMVRSKRTRMVNNSLGAMALYEWRVWDLLLQYLEGESVIKGDIFFLVLSSFVMSPYTRR